jgi:hypothetical protein
MDFGLNQIPLENYVPPHLRGRPDSNIITQQIVDAKRNYNDHAKELTAKNPNHSSNKLRKGAKKKVQRHTEKQDWLRATLKRNAQLSPPTVAPDLNIDYDRASQEARQIGKTLNSSKLFAYAFDSTLNNDGAPNNNEEIQSFTMKSRRSTLLKVTNPGSGRGTRFSVTDFGPLGSGAFVEYSVPFQQTTNTSTASCLLESNLIQGLKDGYGSGLGRVLNRGQQYNDRDPFGAKKHAAGVIILHNVDQGIKDGTIAFNSSMKDCYITQIKDSLSLARNEKYWVVDDDLGSNKRNHSTIESDDDQKLPAEPQQVVSSSSGSSGERNHSTIESDDDQKLPAEPQQVVSSSSGSNKRNHSTIESDDDQKLPAESQQVVSSSSGSSGGGDGEDESNSGGEPKKAKVQKSLTSFFARKK